MVKNNKRFLSFLCCLALILVLIPSLPASAAVASDHVIESSGDGFALYNGVKLPNIDSVWTDKESYTSAVIYFRTNGTICLHLANVGFWFHGSSSDLLLRYLAPDIRYVLDGGTWVLLDQTVSAEYFNAFFVSLIWSSSDIHYYSDDSLYFSATSPIYLDGMTVIEWDGDTEGLTGFPVTDYQTVYPVSSYSFASDAVVVSSDLSVVHSLTLTDSGWQCGGFAYAVDGTAGSFIGFSVFDDGENLDDSVLYCSLLAYTPAEPTTPIYLIDGSWQFDPTISGDDFSLAATFSCDAANFSGSGITYDASLRQLTYSGNNMNDVVAWSVASGWLSEDYRTIVLDDEYSLDETAFSWLVSNAVLLQDAAGDVPNYTTVTIGDQSYRFWAYDQDNYSSSPDVTLTVATVGSKLEYGLRSKIWTYSGDTAFQGFASQSDGEVAYSPGSTYTLAGASDQAAAYTLYPVSELSALTTTVFIDGVEHIFTGDSTELSPLVQLIVAEDTITLAGASGTYTFTPPEGDIFLGLAPSSSVDPTYPIGTYTLGREDTNSVYTLYTVLESLGPLLDTVVIVYSNSGTTLHDSYSASGYGTAPALTLTILHNGLQISNSDGVVSSWTAADPDFFLGFSLQRNATTPSFRPGQSFTIGGGSTDALTNLYVVYSPGYSDINDFEVSSWLVSAVGGFLDFQLWPGMSLNEVMWIILVAGVLFWFLKLTI